MDILGKLHIKGTTSINSIANSSRLIVGGNGGDAYLHFMEVDNGWNLRHKSSDNTLRFRPTLGGADLLTLKDTGHVGIGITNPDSKLHVVGSIKMVDGNEQNDYVLTSDADGIGSWQPWTGGIDKFITGGTYNASTEKIELTTNTGDVIYVPVSPLVDYDDQTLDLASDTLTISKSNSTVDLSTYVNQPNLWTESGANIYRSSNVGIGITNPTTQLTVNRAFSIENTDFNNSTSTGSRLIVGLNGTNGDTFSYIQAQDAGGTSNNNLTLQRYGGNVGIGTTSPTTALSVVGSVSVTSNISLDGQINMPYVNNTSPLDTQSLLQTTTRKAVIAMDMDGDDSYLEYGHVDATQTYTQFRLRDNNTGDRFRIYVDNWTSPSADDRIPLDVRGDKVLLSQDGGNVGIGTVSPTHRLHVEGSIKIVDGTQGLDKVLTSDADGVGSWQTISVGDTNTDSQELTFNSGTNILSISGGNNVNLSSLMDDTNHYLDSASMVGNTLSLGRNGGLANLTVDLSQFLDDTNLWTESGANVYRSSGNVGIGTTSPDTNLHVAGSIKIVDGTEEDNYVLTSNADGLASWKYNPTPIVIYAIDEDELIAGLDWFNTVGSEVAGIIKLGADIELTQNRTFDFGIGIEIWGGDNRIRLNGYVITIVGTSGVFRSVNFTGSINLSNSAVDSQSALILSGSTLGRFTLDSCWFTSVVGHRTFPNPSNYVVSIQGYGEHDFILSMVGIKLSYGGSMTKDPTSFRMELNSQINGLTTMLRDWVVVYGERHTNSTNQGDNPNKYSRTKQGTIIRFDNNSTYTDTNVNKGNPQYKRKFAYDATITWDDDSYTREGGSMSVEQWLHPYPTFWGPTTKEGTNDPLITSTFGNPGDLYYRPSGEIYIKHTSLGTNTQWKEIGGDTNTDNQQLALNTNILSLTNSTPDIDLSKYEQTLSFNNPNLTLSDGGGTVNLSSLNTNTNYYLNSANIAGNTLTLGVNGTSDVSVNLNWTQNGNNLHNANSGKVGIGETAPNSTLEVGGSVSLNYTWDPPNNTMLDDSHYWVLVNTNPVQHNGGKNIKLPTAAGCEGRVYVIKNFGTGMVSILPFGSEKIDGGDDQLRIEGTMYAVTIASSGVDWFIISDMKTDVNGADYGVYNTAANILHAGGYGGA